MGEFNDRFEGLSSDLRVRRYERLAEAALQHYALDDVTSVFLRHNGGVTYCLQNQDDTPRYLLKIAQPAGESGRVPPQRLQLVLEWLAALARESTIVVQEPVANRHGAWLTAVEFDDLSEPFFCSVQRWIDGEHVRGPFTPLQAYRVGAMIGELHRHSSGWTVGRSHGGIEQDETWLLDRMVTLYRVVKAGLLTHREWQMVESAATQIADAMRAFGRSQECWGAIHGDLHHENLLFHGDSVRPIDFGDFRVAHFAYDLGVVLYHLMYLDDVGVRRALVAGYRSVRSAFDAVPLWPESYLCAAALSNLSFQVTIPSQRSSAHFARNVREFAISFCHDLVAGRAFVSTKMFLQTL